MVRSISLVLIALSQLYLVYGLIIRCRCLLWDLLILTSFLWFKGQCWKILIHKCLSWTELHHGSLIKIIVHFHIQAFSLRQWNSVIVSKAWKTFQHLHSCIDNCSYLSPHCLNHSGQLFIKLHITALWSETRWAILITLTPTNQPFHDVWTNVDKFDPNLSSHLPVSGETTLPKDASTAQ